MKTFIQPGAIVAVPAPAAVKSGDLVVVGSLFGIAATDADSGATVEIQTEGVFSLPKVSAQAWSVGARIYWDATTGKATTAANDGGTPATAFVAIGHAVAGASNPSATGTVRLSI
jgi:predicted RecA/RadA family phage recombinase